MGEFAIHYGDNWARIAEPTHASPESAALHQRLPSATGASESSACEQVAATLALPKSLGKLIAELFLRGASLCFIKPGALEERARVQQRILESVLKTAAALQERGAVLCKHIAADEEIHASKS